MAVPKRILIVGLQPQLIDFSGPCFAALPDFDGEKAVEGTDGRGRKLADGDGRAKKGPVIRRESRPCENWKVLTGCAQKKRMVLVAMRACSSSEQPALVGAPEATSVGFTRSLLSR